MSLTVRSEMIEQAGRSRVDESEFVAVVQTSLPRAWQIVDGLVDKLKSGDNALESYGSGPMDEATRGELLRMLAGTAIRRAVERHFGITLLFQNCNNVALVPAGQEGSLDAQEFCSIESQILNQQPQYPMC